MPRCNNTDCEARAVAKLIGADGYAKAYRCRECLLAALEAEDP